PRPETGEVSDEPSDRGPGRRHGAGLRRSVRRVLGVPAGGRTRSGRPGGRPRPGRHRRRGPVRPAVGAAMTAESFTGPVGSAPAPPGGRESAGPLPPP